MHDPLKNRLINGRLIMACQICDCVELSACMVSRKFGNYYLHCCERHLAAAKLIIMHDIQRGWNNLPNIPLAELITIEYLQEYRAKEWLFARKNTVEKIIM